MKKKFIKFSIYVLLAKVMMSIFSFITQIFIVRRFSVADYGLYNLFRHMVNFLFSFTLFGIPNVFTRYIPEYIVNKEYKSLWKIIGIGTIIRICLAGIIGILLFIYKDFWIEFFKIPSHGELYFIYAVLMLLLATFLHSIGERTFTAFQLQGKVQITNVLGSIVTLIGFWLTLIYDLGIQGLLLTVIIFYSIKIIFYLVNLINLFYKQYNPLKSSQDNQIDWKRIIKYIVPYIFTTPATLLLNVSIDNIIIGKYLGIDYVAYYSLAFYLPTLIFQWSPATLFMPFIHIDTLTEYVKGDTNILIRRFKRINEVNLIFSIPVFLGGIIFAKEIFEYIYNSVNYDINLLAILLQLSFIGMAVKIFVISFDSILQGKEKTAVYLYNLLSATYNLVMDFVLIKYFGIIGVAFATSSAILLKYILMYLHIRFKLKIYLGFIDKKRLKEIFIPLLGMVGLSLICKLFVNSFISLGVSILSIIVGYLFLLTLMKNDDILILFDKIRRK